MEIFYKVMLTLSIITGVCFPMDMLLDKSRGPSAARATFVGCLLLSLLVGWPAYGILMTWQ